jgi:hypothetical protein
MGNQGYNSSTVLNNNTPIVVTVPNALCGKVGIVVDHIYQQYYVVDLGDLITTLPRSHFTVLIQPHPPAWAVDDGDLSCPKEATL